MLLEEFKNSRTTSYTARMIWTNGKRFFKIRYCKYMDTILMGYSVNIVNSDPDWTRERRLQFLIDPHIRLPKSVDSSVWEESYDFLDELSEQEMMDNYIKWRDKERLIDLTGYSVTEKNRVLTASYLHFFDYVPTEVWAMEYRSESINKDFIFLGYDVANGSTLSGLSN